MNPIELDKLEERERALYADNRVELAGLLRMALDALEEKAYTERMLDNAEGEVDDLRRKLFLVFEMVSDADDLEKLQKFIARIEADLTLSGVQP
jgi:hypothetical protein